MLSPKEVRTAMLVKLKASGLTEKDAKVLGYAPLTAAQVTKEYPTLTSTPLGGFLLPYYDPAGNSTEFFRYRYLENPVRQGFAALTVTKPLRYVQPAGLAPRVYAPLNYDWVKLWATSPEKRRLFITEGELKAACACKLGVPTVGLGGVWNFKTANSNLIDDLEQVPWADMTTYICYDSDSRTNRQVLQARNFLSRQLTDRKAYVHIIDLPELELGVKTGLDDFLVAEGVEEFNKLVDEAEPYAPGQELHKLNEEVVYLVDPGTVYRWDNGKRITPVEFRDHQYSTRKIVVETQTDKGTKKTEKSAAVEWLKWPGRAELLRTTYKPGQPAITDAKELNSWTSWGLPANVISKGDLSLWNELIAFLFKHAEPEHKEWFLNWLAYPLQYPGTKLFTSVVLWGLAQGTGKTLIGHTMQRVYGRNFIEIGNHQLSAGFNEWAAQRQFVLADEIAGDEKRTNSDYMKSMITQREITINAKYEKLYTVPDCINYMFTSNHPDSVFVEDADRRYFVHEVVGQPLSPAFYKAYDAWYRSDAVGALFHSLFTRNLGAFEPHAHAPMTAAKRQLIQTGRSEAGNYIAGLRDGSTELCVGQKPMPWTLWTSAEIYNSYMRGDPNKRLTLPGLGKELARAGFRKVLNGDNIRTVGKVQSLWAVGPKADEALAIQNPKRIADWYNAERGLLNGNGHIKKEKF